MASPRDSGDGVVNGSDIYRAVVVNHAKLAYNGVSAWLEGASPALAQMSSLPGLGEQLRIQAGLHNP